MSETKTVDVLALRRENRNLKKYLKLLTAEVRVHADNMETLMKQRESYERGVKIAKSLNALEMANDQARYFGLGVSYRAQKRDA